MMNAIKIFTGIVAFIIWFGFLGPYMVSAESDLLALGWGITTLAGFVYAFYTIIRSIK